MKSDKNQSKGSAEKQVVNKKPGEALGRKHVVTNTSDQPTSPPPEFTSSSGDTVKPQDASSTDQTSSQDSAQD